MHEDFQEICAAASIAQATPDELARLQEHLVHCGSCRRTYSEFTNVAAQHYVEDLQRRGILPEEEQQIPSSSSLKQRFLQRAAEQGILESAKTELVERKDRLQAFRDAWDSLLQPWSWKPALAVIALGAVLASVIGAYMLGVRMSTKQTRGEEALQPAAATIPVPVAHNLGLQQEIDRLQNDLAKTQLHVRSLREELEATSDDKQRLTEEQGRLETEAAALGRQLATTEASLQTASSDRTNLQEELAKLKSQVASAQAAYIENQIKIRELGAEVADKTSALERDGQMLQRDRDIRDLMTARNLHIFDVFDTDAKGKTSPAFGRIFYTEGESLIFYAYDLNDAKVQNANYHYRVWGSQDGQSDRPKSLGVFYSDDKSQRRWVFKCDNPKILAEIDSVFVTLEPSDATSHPKGQKLLDAYLRGMANHP
jgi:predicted  nucleic acid-binding Zn-ribbon protein